MDISSHFKDEDIATKTRRRFKWISFSLKTPDFSKSSSIEYSIILTTKYKSYGYAEANKPIGICEITKYLNDPKAQLYYVNEDRTDFRNKFLSYNKDSIFEYGTWKEKKLGRKSLEKNEEDTTSDLHENYIFDGNTTEYKKSIKFQEVIVRTQKTRLYWYWGPNDAAKELAYKESEYDKNPTSVSILKINYGQKETKFSRYFGQSKVILLYPDPKIIHYNQLYPLGGDYEYILNSIDISSNIQFIAKECWIVSINSPLDYIPKNEDSNLLLQKIDKQLVFNSNIPTIIPQWIPKILPQCLYVHNRNGSEQPCEEPQTHNNIGCILCLFDMKLNNIKYNYRCTTKNCKGIVSHFSYERDGERICTNCKKNNIPEPKKIYCENDNCKNLAISAKIVYCKSCYDKLNKLVGEEEEEEEEEKEEEEEELKPIKRKIPKLVTRAAPLAAQIVPKTTKSYVCLRKIYLFRKYK